MALSDYIPQLFGSAPQGYKGLLDDEQTQALQKQANLQGLLSSAAAIAQGMSAQGPRRSAAQNILGALGAGFGATGQAYQQGLQQQIQQQQLGMQQRQLAGAEQLKIKYPDLAQMIDTNLPGAMRIIADIEQEKRQPKLMAAKPGEVIIGPDGKVVYTAPSAAEKNAKILTADEAKSLGLPAGVIYQQGSDGKISPIEGTVRNLPSDVQSYEYAKEKGYKGSFEDWKKMSSAAPKVSVNVGEKSFEEKLGGKVGENIDAAFQKAQGAQETLNIISNIKPLIKQGVYAGPISSAPLRTIDQLASSFGFASGTTEQKLARTAEAMQGLAGLELSAAAGMKGQGPITENERGLIRRAAAGDFATFTQNEVITLLDALEKQANYRINLHQKNYQMMLKNDKLKNIAPYYELNPTRKYNPATGALE